MTQKNLLLAAILIALPVTAGAFWYLSQRQIVPNPPVVTDPVVEVPVQTELETPIDTSEWKTYRNEEYGFEFKLPLEWTIEKTTTPASFYLRSDNFKPVLMGYLYTGMPFYSDGEIQVEISDNSNNLSIQKRYLQYDDIYRLYIDNPTLPYIQKKIHDYDVLIFETHRGFGSNLTSDEYQTVRILKIKNKILHFDYISQDKPDSRIERILEEVVSSVSDI